MALQTEFVPLQLGELHACAEKMKEEGYRFIQTHAVHVDDGTDLYYSFMKDGKVTSYRIEGVKATDPVPSITDVFLAAFVFENEARELFGVDMHDIAIDFDGAMYAPAESEPMTFISPEMKAAKDKARKAAAAKAAKEAKDAAAASAEKKPAVDIEAKLAGMDPEKAAKVRAAMEAKAAKEAKAAEKTPVADDALEAKLASMDPEKAAKVRAAMEAKAARAAAAEAGEEN